MKHLVPLLFALALTATAQVEIATESASPDSGLEVKPVDTASPAPSPAMGTSDQPPNGQAENQPSPAAVEAATPEQVDLFLAEPINPARNYAMAWLTDHVRQGRVLLKAFPDRAEEINRVLAPFIEELERHRKGHRKFEGKWYSPGDWFEFEEARGKQLWEDFFKDGPTYALSGTVIPPDTALIIRSISLVSVLVLIGLTIQSILSLCHHFSWMPLFGIALPVCLLGLYAWTLFGILQTPEGYAALPPPASLSGQNNAPRELIYHSLRDPHDGGTPSPNSILITPADADAFIAGHVTIVPPDQPSFFRFTRQQLRISSDDRDWIIYDAGTWLGRPMVFTYRISFYGASYQVSGALGRATIPARAVESAWNALDAFARKITGEARVTESYNPSRMDVRGIEFRRKTL